MANLTAISILHATILLALASIGSQASFCDFELSQDHLGLITRIKVGNTIAVVELLNSDGAWRSFAKSGNNVTCHDQTDFEKTSDYGKIPRVYRAMIENYIAMQLVGIKVSTQNGDFRIHPNENSVKVEFDEDNNVYKFHENGIKPMVYANGSAFNFAHIFYNDVSAVTLINLQCDEVQTLPLDKLEPKLQSFLKHSMYGDAIRI